MFWRIKDVDLQRDDRLCSSVNTSLLLTKIKGCRYERFALLVADGAFKIKRVLCACGQLQCVQCVQSMICC